MVAGYLQATPGYSRTVMQVNVAKSLPRSLSVRSKLIVAFVSLTFVAVAVVSWIGYVSARKSLQEAAERQLLGLQRSKSAMVKATLDSVRNEVLTLAASSLVVNASTELRAAYRQLDRETITPEMKSEIEHFYQDEFASALMSNASLAALEGSLLPSSTAGLYVDYHYMAKAPKPYGVKRMNQADTDHSAYGKAVEKYLSNLEEVVERLGMENITLVDPETMEVFFTIEQSTVVGTNIATGPYSGTNMANLGRILAKSQIKGDYKVADFEMYLPALGSPRAFLGTPVFDGPRVIAVMILRIPNEQIARILSGNRSWEAEGLGKSGEVYLLGPDQTMRTDSRFLIEDKAAFIQSLRHSTLTSGNVDKVEKLGTTILTVPVKHEAAVAALSGQNGLIRLGDYRGVPSLMAYGPVDLDSVRWGVIAKIDEAEAMAPLREYAIRVLVWGVGLSLLATMMALAAAHTLTQPITALVKAAKKVSQGALDVEVEVIARDEYREFGEVFNEMVSNLRTSRQELQHQVQENERLLMSLLPASGAAQVREGNAEARQSFADVTVAYVNFSGFDSLPANIGETDSMALLSDLVAACDEAAEQYGVEKVRTIGSSYLAVSGLSVERPDHTALMVQFSSEVVRIVRRFNAERGVNLVAEIGINAGPVIGGLVGGRKFIYDLWGDTVKLARGIESDGQMSILVTRPVYDRVRDLVSFGAATRSDVRGMGQVELFSVLDEASG